MMSLENDLPLCHSVSQGPRDPCAKDECSHRNTCTRYRAKDASDNCAGCSIWTECPALALRNKRNGCSHFKPFQMVDYPACLTPANGPPDLQKENEQLRAQLRVLAEASSTFLHLHKNLMKTHNSWGEYSKQAIAFKRCWT